MQFARDHKNLPAIQPSAAAVIRSDSSAALVKAENPPKGVRIGIVKLMLSFPAPGLSPADGQLLSSVYFEAVADFAPAVVIWTLRWLLFHNPRNTPGFTCAPTPQDVREACRDTNSCWRRWVVEFYFGGAWAELSRSTSDDLMSRRDAAIKGGKPGDPDCIVPFDLQLHYLREEIGRLTEIEAARKRMGLGFPESPLLLIKDDIFDRIPYAAFLDGALEIIRVKRAAKAEAARKAAERNAYLASLPDEVRAVRWTVVFSEKWKDKDEPEVMAETNRRLERVRAARAEAESCGGEFTGCMLEDGTEWSESAAIRQKVWRRGLENQP